MKKIAFLLPFLKTGGIERVALSYLELLSKNGYEIDLYVDYDLGKEGNKMLHLLPANIKPKFIKSRFISSTTYKIRNIAKVIPGFIVFLYLFVFITDVFYIIKTKPRIKKRKYNISISFYQFLPFYFPKKNISNIIWIHGSIEHFFPPRLHFLHRLYARKLTNYDKIVTISKEMNNQILSRYPSELHNKLVTIYNPFNFDQIRKLSEDKILNSTIPKIIPNKYIVTVCRLDENQKDVTTIIRALNYISKFPNLKLIVVGDGPSKSRLVEISEKIGVAEKVIFVGNQSNPYPWIKNADLLILSSKFEGLPTVLVEALILNIPIISSDCKTGPNEILQKGELGMLFPVGDHILLAKKIEQMLSSTKLRDEFIGKYEQSLNRFSGESILAIFRRMTDET